MPFPPTTPEEELAELQADHQSIMLCYDSHLGDWTRHLVGHLIAFGFAGCAVYTAARNDGLSTACLIGTAIMISVFEHFAGKRLERDGRRVRSLATDWQRRAAELSYRIANRA